MASSGTSQDGAAVVVETERRDRIGVLGRGVASNIAGMLLTGAVAIAITPIMIRGLGDFYYGVLMLANSVLSYYGLLGLGVNTTVHRSVARAEGSGEREHASETMSAAVALMTLMAGLTVVVTLGVIVLLPRFGLVAPEAVPLFRQVLILLGTSVALSFPATPAAAYLRGIHRFDLANGIQSGGALLRGAGIWAVLAGGHGVLAVCWVTLASSVLLLAAHLVAVQRLEPGLVRFRLGLHWQRIRRLFQFSFYVFLTGIGDYFRFQLDLIVIAKVIGVAAVTPYSVALTLTLYYQNIMTGFSGPLMTELIKIDGAKENARGFFLRGSKFSILLATLGGVLLVANGRQLLHVWVGPQFVGMIAVLALLTLAHWADRGQAPSLYLLYSRDRHHAMAYWTIVEGLCNLGLSIYLGAKIGLIGVAIGTAAPMLVVKLIVQPLYTLRIIGSSVKEYLSASVLRPACIGALVWLAAAAFQQQTASIPMLVFNIAWQSALFATLTYFIGLTGEEREMLSQRATRVRLMLLRRTA